jgi:cell division protein FtsI (penicillin-binding protein 3)
MNGSVVVMDAQTGEILALATAPTFNADDPGATPAEQRGNPAISQVYEPGSVTKIVTAAAALEAGVVTPDTVNSVPSTLQVAGRTFHDSHSHPVEQMTFTGVIVESSNVGTIKVAQQLGEQRLHDALASFGFGAKTGLGLPGESRGVLPDVKDWSGTSIATIPIGQGVSANAVQMASVYATVANNGVRMSPSIVKATVSPDGTVVPAPAPTATRVVSEAVSKQLQVMLEGVVSAEGTAPLAAIPGYRIAGKTGTAQRTLPGVRGYAAGHYTSSFVGFAPADAPRLVTAVVLQDTGKNGYYGGAVAGPVFKDVMGFALRSLKVPPTGTTPPQLTLRVG